MNNASPAGPVSDPTEQSSARGAEASVEANSIQHARRQATVKFFDHLIRDVDLIFYCELSILYYMDCSMLKFFLRALPHWFSFTPKPEIIPPIPPGQRQYIGFIFGTNLTCMLLHLIFRPPAAGEATRGYLHGGWLIDFIGHQSPISKARLLSLDILCLGIQLLMLSITLAKHEVTSSIDASRKRNSSQQDHDAEEAGIMRAVGMSPEDIELQLSGTSERNPTNLGDEPSEDSQLIDRNSNHHLDTFYSGEHMLTNVDIVETVRSQWKSRRTVVASVASSGLETAASIAGRRLTITFGRGRTLG